MAIRTLIYPVDPTGKIETHAFMQNDFEILKKVFVSISESQHKEVVTRARQIAPNVLFDFYNRKSKLSEEFVTDKFEVRKKDRERKREKERKKRN